MVRLVLTLRALLKVFLLRSSSCLRGSRTAERRRSPSFLGIRLFPLRDFLLVDSVAEFTGGLS